MSSGEQNIPLQVVKLLVGHFSRTNTEAEKDALDEWICANDDNMKVFEECLEASLRPVQLDPDFQTEEDELRYIVDLAMKHFKKTITLKEKQTLDEWVSLSERNKKLFSEVPDTNDMEEIYHWLFERVRKEHDRIRSN